MVDVGGPEEDADDGAEGITLSAISNKWKANERLSGGEEYPRRTFMNHKKDIWDIFGIEIGCHKFSNSYYHVEPYALKVFKRRWYLLGKYGDSPLKLYALDRFLNIDIEFEDFTLPQDFNASAYFSTCFGIILDEEEPQVIKLKVDNYQANYLRSLPLHHSQKELEHTDDHTLFSYYLRPSFDLVQELLSMGETVEVLEPASLRSEMERIGKEIVKRHKGKRK